ncbi:stAR-related lipid transfer protein 9-like isoform X2 [Ambystoma mexicanum]|uniref:stAR-related lipid transfer protein 9-like isoform X2 n=1 Tax=Ambystoma mexicanum TaxID=8296 RepID=UPI0037E776E2
MANVKVALRVRPLSKREIAEGTSIIVQIDGNAARLRNIKDGRLEYSGESRERILEFGFDYSYWSVDTEDPRYASQEVVFQDLGTSVLSGAFKGYNVCLFAYGQTGSGKTYTMMGTPASVGLTPRICEGLFAMQDDYEGRAPSSSRIEVSFLEIYNERVRDLLKQPDRKKPYTLRVREHPEKGPYVQGLSQHAVTDYKQVLELLEEGIANRITAATHVHDASSRSHAIFTIHYTQAILENNLPSEIVSKINLVDLAGSERASPSYCKDRITEGSNINKSLVTLGIVISTLAQNSQMFSSCQSINSIASEGDSSNHSSAGSRRLPYIPYRDSILTWLLKDSLGGNSKTLMIATVSPSSASYNETMSTLRYASNAKNIINTPRVNEDTNVKLIRELRQEIDRLKTMLMTFELRNSSPSFSDDRDGSLSDLVLQNEQKIEQLTKDWTDKWSDGDAMTEEHNVDINKGKASVAIDSSLPHLIAVDEDILSTGVVLYYLRDGNTNIGRNDSGQEQDIVLPGQWIERHHCMIENTNGTVTLRPVQGAQCIVNGQPVTEACRLSQGAVVVLGKTHKFRFNHPAEAALLRRRRSNSVASILTRSSLDWLDLDGDFSMPKQYDFSSVSQRRNLDEVHLAYQEKLRNLEAFYRERVRQQQIYVDDLKQQLLAVQIRGERELEEDQALINQQIKENHLSLVQEEERLFSLRQKHESGVQTESKTFAEAEVQNTVETNAVPSVEEQGRKKLVQLELLHRYALRKAERNISRKRVKFHLEKIVKKQKLLQAKKNLQHLEVVCWLSEERLKKILSTNRIGALASCDATVLDLSLTSDRITPQHRRHSSSNLSSCVNSDPVSKYNSRLKIKDPSHLSTSLNTSQSHDDCPPKKSRSVDCLAITGSSCLKRANVNCMRNSTSLPEIRLAKSKDAHSAGNLEYINEDCSAPFHPVSPLEHHKMEKAKSRPRQVGIKSKAANSKPLTTGNTVRKSKMLGDYSQQSSVPLRRAVNPVCNRKDKQDVDSAPGTSVKDTKKAVVPGKPSLGRSKQMVKTLKSETRVPLAGVQRQPVVKQEILATASSVGSINKMNTHVPLRHLNKKWHSTEVLAASAPRGAPGFLEKCQEDDESESTDTESAFSVDSLSSAYANALAEKLKQEDLERNAFASNQEDSGSEDSEMSQDSLVEKRIKSKRNRGKTFQKVNTVQGPNGSFNGVKDHSPLALANLGSLGSGLQKKERSFSMDSLADAEEVPEAESSDEMPAESFWKMQSPRLPSLSHSKDFRKPDAFENYAALENSLDASPSFYLGIQEEAASRQTCRSSLMDMGDCFKPSPWICDEETKKIFGSPLSLSDTWSSCGSKSEHTGPHIASDPLSASPETSFGSIVLGLPTNSKNEGNLKQASAEEPFLSHSKTGKDPPLFNGLKPNITSSDASDDNSQGMKTDGCTVVRAAHIQPTRSYKLSKEFGNVDHCSKEDPHNVPPLCHSPMPSDKGTPTHYTISAEGEDCVMKSSDMESVVSQPRASFEKASDDGLSDVTSENSRDVFHHIPGLSGPLKSELASPGNHRVRESISTPDPISENLTAKNTAEAVANESVFAGLGEEHLSFGEALITSEGRLESCADTFSSSLDSCNETLESTIAEACLTSCDDGSRFVNIAHKEAILSSYDGEEDVCPCESSAGGESVDSRFQNCDLTSMEKAPSGEMSLGTIYSRKYFSDVTEGKPSESEYLTIRNLDSCDGLPSLETDQAEDMYLQERRGTPTEAILNVLSCASSNNFECMGSREDCELHRPDPVKKELHHVLQPDHATYCATQLIQTDKAQPTHASTAEIGQIARTFQNVARNMQSEYFAEVCEKSITNFPESGASNMCPLVTIGGGRFEVSSSASCIDLLNAHLQELGTVYPHVSHKPSDLHVSQEAEASEITEPQNVQATVTVEIEQMHLSFCTEINPGTDSRGGTYSPRACITNPLNNTNPENDIVSTSDSIPKVKRERRTVASLLKDKSLSCPNKEQDIVLYDPAMKVNVQEEIEHGLPVQTLGKVKEEPMSSTNTGMCMNMTNHDGQKLSRSTRSVDDNVSRVTQQEPHDLPVNPKDAAIEEYLACPKKEQDIVLSDPAMRVHEEIRHRVPVHALSNIKEKPIPLKNTCISMNMENHDGGTLNRCTDANPSRVAQQEAHDRPVDPKGAIGEYQEETVIPFLSLDNISQMELGKSETSLKGNKIINVNHQHLMGPVGTEAGRATVMETNVGHLHERCISQKGGSIPMDDFLPQYDISICASQDTLSPYNETIQNSNAMKSSSLAAIVSLGYQQEMLLSTTKCDQECSGDTDTKSCRNVVLLPLDVVSKVDNISNGTPITSEPVKQLEKGTEGNITLFHMGQTYALERSYLHTQNVPENVGAAGGIPARASAADPQKQISLMSSVEKLTEDSLVKTTVNGMLESPDVNPEMSTIGQSMKRSITDDRPPNGQKYMKEELCGNVSGNDDKDGNSSSADVQYSGVSEMIGQQSELLADGSLYELDEMMSADKEDTHLSQMYKVTGENLKTLKASSLNDSNLFNGKCSQRADNASNVYNTTKNESGQLAASHDQPLTEVAFAETLDIADPLLKPNDSRCKAESASTFSPTRVLNSNENRAPFPGTSTCPEIVMRDRIEITEDVLTLKNELQILDSVYSEQPKGNGKQGVMLQATDSSNSVEDNVCLEKVGSNFLSLRASGANVKQSVQSINPTKENVLVDVVAGQISPYPKRSTSHEIVDPLENAIPIEGADVKLLKGPTAANMGTQCPRTIAQYKDCPEEPGCESHICSLSPSSHNGSTIGLQENNSIPEPTNHNPPSGAEYLKPSIMCSDSCEFLVTQSNTPAAPEHLQNKLANDIKHSEMKSDLLSLSPSVLHASNHCKEVKHRTSSTTQREEQMFKPTMHSADSTKCTLQEKCTQSLPLAEYICNSPANTQGQNSTGMLGCGQHKIIGQTSLSQTPSQAEKVNPDIRYLYNDLSHKDGTSNMTEYSSLPHSPTFSPGIQTQVNVKISVNKTAPHQSVPLIPTGADYAKGALLNLHESSALLQNCNRISEPLEANPENNALSSEGTDSPVCHRIPKETLCGAFVDQDPYSNQQAVLLALEKNSSNCFGRSSSYVPFSADSTSQVCSPNLKVFSGDLGLLNHLSLAQAKHQTSLPVEVREMESATQTCYFVPRLIGEELVKEAEKLATELPTPMDTGLKSISDLQRYSLDSPDSITIVGKQRHPLESVVREGTLPSGLYSKKVILSESTKQPKYLSIGNDIENMILPQFISEVQSDGCPELIRLEPKNLVEEFVDSSYNYVEEETVFSKENAVSAMKDTDYKNSTRKTSKPPHDRPDDVKEMGQNRIFTRQTQACRVGRKFCMPVRDSAPDRAGNHTENQEHKVAKDIEKKNILKSERLKSSLIGKMSLSGLSKNRSVLSEHEGSAVASTDVQLFLDAVHCIEDEQHMHPHSHQSSDPAIAVTSNSEHIAYTFSRSLQDLDMSVEPPSPTEDEDLINIRKPLETKSGHSTVDDPKLCRKQKATQTSQFRLPGKINAQTSSESSTVNESSLSSVELDDPLILIKADISNGKSNIPNHEADCKANIAVKKLRNQKVEPLSCLHDRKDVMHFGSSDINPYAHPWQQEKHCRVGWKQYIFGSASDVSSIQAPQGLDDHKVMRCSSVDNGLNTQRSPFQSHLSSYVNARVISSTLSSIEDSQGWDDECPDFEPTYSSDGVKHYYPRSSEVIITKHEDCVSQFESPCRSPGNNSLPVDEIVLLYPSESESSGKQEKVTCEQGTQTVTKTRFRRLNKQQQSYPDMQKSKPEVGRRCFQRPASLTNMQNLSFHLSQLLHDTSELLGNLSQQRHLVSDSMANSNQRVFSKTNKRTLLSDTSTQTTSDKGIQTELLLDTVTTDRERLAHQQLDKNCEQDPIAGQVVGLDAADAAHQRENIMLLQDERTHQKINVCMQSMSNLTQDRHPNSMQESVIAPISLLRSSTPSLADFPPALSHSHQQSVVLSHMVSPVTSPSSSPEQDTSINAVVRGPASSTPELSDLQTMLKQEDENMDRRQSYKKTLLVDRASSPILTLNASPNSSKSSYSVRESLKPESSVPKSSFRQRKQGSASWKFTDVSIDSSSQTEADSQSSSLPKPDHSHRKVAKDLQEADTPGQSKFKSNFHSTTKGVKEILSKECRYSDGSLDFSDNGDRESLNKGELKTIPFEHSLPGKYSSVDGIDILGTDVESSNTLFVKKAYQCLAPIWQKSSSVENIFHAPEKSNCPFVYHPARSCTNSAGKSDEKKRSPGYLRTTSTRAHNHSFRINTNDDPISTSGTSDMTVLLPEDDAASVAASECNTDILLSENPAVVLTQRPRSYSLRDLPQHNKFSNWSGVQPNPMSPVSLLSSASDLQSEAPNKHTGSGNSQTEAKANLHKSKATEIEMLRRERAQVMSGIQLDLNQHPLTVELAEAKLSYGIGETDALLRTLKSGKGEALNSVSMKQQFYERHMKSIEALRKEREERLQSFRRSRSLSPQKHLSLSQASLNSQRDLDLPSRRREYLQQLRKDVVDNTRVQEPKRRSAQCPSEIEVLLRDYTRAREEAKTEIARARDKLRERAEQEKRRLHQQMVSHLIKEESKMKSLASTSTLCTGSSLSLSSGPTSGYNSCNTATYAASKYITREEQMVPRSMEDPKRNVRGRSSMRNSELYVLDTSSNNSDPEASSTSRDCRVSLTPPQSGGSSPLSTRSIELSFKHSPSSPSTSYKDLAKLTLANATAEIMTACSYNLGNLFKCQATAGWKYQCTEQEVMVYYKTYPSATRHGFLGAGVIAQSLQSVWCTVRDATKRHLYDKAITKLQVHRRVSNDIQLVYLMSDMSQCYLKQPRDFCCISVESREERWFTVAFQSVYDESMPRPSKDTVRGEILPSAWILLPDTVNGKSITRVIYSLEVELGATACPAKLLSTIAKQQPLVIANLANFLST